ncbi:unnamed protein product [Knipowitschia caucasica]
MQRRPSDAMLCFLKVPAALSHPFASYILWPLSCLLTPHARHTIGGGAGASCVEQPVAPSNLLWAGLTFLLLCIHETGGSAPRAGYATAWYVSGSPHACDSIKLTLLTMTNIFEFFYCIGVFYSSTIWRLLTCLGIDTFGEDERLCLAYLDAPASALFGDKGEESMLVLRTEGVLFATQDQKNLIGSVGVFLCALLSAPKPHAPTTGGASTS